MIGEHCARCSGDECGCYCHHREVSWGISDKYGSGGGLSAECNYNSWRKRWSWSVTIQADGDYGSWTIPIEDPEVLKELVKTMGEAIRWMESESRGE